MILKLCMQHQGLKVYKVCINDDPGLIFTCLTARSNLFAYRLEWEKLLRSLKGKKDAENDQV